MQGLEVRGLKKSFGGLTVAEGIDFDLAPGARKALIGPNGAGKTTFANLVTGKLTPTAGTIRFDGADIGALGESQRVKRGIAKTFQITTLFRSLTVRENIRLPILERRGHGGRIFGRAARDREVEAEIEALLDQFALLTLADRPVQLLAYGQQRLVELALTLALKPRVVILDEPAAGVPSSESHLILQAIERLPGDLAVLIIEHDMDLVFRVARSIVVLVNGRILTEGTPEQIGRDPMVRKLYLGESHV
ncbi:ABC transporter ATP-binding protein [Neorhizobium galegae]|uniref:Branched-chain amino acid ABC transporter, ATP-binding protein n=1 Tax=Neorhizobium galegae bv. orientalis str. HAMBI 540 TaxID=1028800 RepID=A0A068SYX5_NEOGA|nr:ABC transporter ATP-binding protein [Neorhizobium galegae]MCQ1852875.1 ABC transporter ATP-binding protein [Neorhizobium galegae]CDN51074.1 Branched-chain amino acid ABC transporter, ATP-binding protein [Neorhizobium galegae bv. orientalis str. HAMBI 540]CDZ44154.1 ABC-type branched-chain amino acid transport system, ATPase component [Neorhizobium galegae bv. orientalis]